ncbi:MAG TPA: HAMP domain-containing sensor histidine kinase [Gemmatimonadaceae bacterium]
MSFRTRLLVALLVVVLVPLLAFAVGLRREMDTRLTAQYQQRVAALVDVIHDDLAQENASIADRLSTLTAALADDNRFRLAALRAPDGERGYLLDYAGRAMRLAGLSMLQIQDSAGRIISSGHFRNEYDRLEPELPQRLAGVERGMAIVQARSPEGPFLVLARMDSLRIAGHRFTVVGGMALDHAALARLARGRDLAVTLVSPAGVLSSDSLLERNTTRWLSLAGDDSSAAARPAAGFLVADVTIPFLDTRTGAPGAAVPARLVIAHPLAPLLGLRRSIDLWFLASFGVTAVVAILLGVWASARVSRPLVDLADTTASVDLDNLDVRFPGDRDDEIGTLSRLLNAMVRRLKVSASRLRDAERRAAVGELARQVNHDIKNGLTPIRNVVRHLSQVAREQPAELPTVFAERQGTLESSIAYLESLARNYARLSPQLGARPCDVNAVAQQVLRDTQTPPGAELRTRLAERLPPVFGDEVVVRRILENLVGNAIDSLESQAGSVVVSTELRAGDPRRPLVRITVADTGHGMTEQQLNRAFDDFYTTKPSGTGLGLSVVRRLVLDLNGSLHVDTAPGEGTRFVVELPVWVQAPAPQGAAAATVPTDSRRTAGLPAPAPPASASTPPASSTGSAR